MVEAKDKDVWWGDIKKNTPGGGAAVVGGVDWGGDAPAASGALTAIPHEPWPSAARRPTSMSPPPRPDRRALRVAGSAADAGPARVETACDTLTQRE